MKKRSVFNFIVTNNLGTFAVEKLVSGRGKDQKSCVLTGMNGKKSVGDKIFSIKKLYPYEKEMYRARKR
jgi:hypothetical protein